ncbi:hypothetical protein H920_19174 [Fukomys damarensis]|uniref:Uncharacterized protein n=1 Tax=Fukomys damarensis TaxID=885580 RepID=A0A091CPE3_FUKDA|nr:hypothetical protein H920_19174 [Fukomys damarensis]
MAGESLPAAYAPLASGSRARQPQPGGEAQRQAMETPNSASTDCSAFSALPRTWVLE